MKPAVREAISRTIRGPRVDFLMSIDDGAATLAFADALSEIINEFFQGTDLGLRGMIAVEISHEADAE
jgi:uncharacterized protein YgfB (UPF0149 family)